MMFLLDAVLFINVILGIYTYDRIHNRPIALDTAFNNVYYTSNNFHSIEYTNFLPGNSSFITNTTNTSKLCLKLRTVNSSKSLPNLHNI